jgi:uncharacterized protein YecE (DUF72 family)
MCDDTALYSSFNTFNFQVPVSPLPNGLRYTTAVNHPPILLGTSSFTASGWNGSFYPRGMKPSDYLAFYAERFHTVEVDSTFYACPTARTVENWNARTPQGFVFSVKVPQTITHDKVLVDCDAEFSEFLETMEILGEKLGPIIFQFPFFNRSVFPDRHAFTDRLVPFLKKLTADHKFGIEIRNRDWLDAEFADLLRDHQIALVLQDRSWMPNPLKLQFDPITAGWTYIRWLGDRKQIEAQTMTWDKAVVDRTAELSSWVDFCYQIMKRGVLIYAYANNHFQGHGPATIAKFLELWTANGFGKIAGPEPSKRQTTLFPMS